MCVALSTYACARVFVHALEIHVRAHNLDALTHLRSFSYLISVSFRGVGEASGHMLEYIIGVYLGSVSEAFRDIAGRLRKRKNNSTHISKLR